MIENRNRIGVDLGGTKTEVILTRDIPSDVIHRKRIPTQQEKGYEHIISLVVGLIRECMKRCDGSPVIGIGIPGSLSQKTGRVGNAKNGV